MANIGPYQILEEIGRGGMGVVFRAMDPIIGRVVAIKVLRMNDFDTTAEIGDARRRFAREAAAAGRLSHPSIVIVHHVGEDRGHPYLVMEMVIGKSLQTVIAAQRHPPLLQKLEFLRQIAEALDYAHTQGVVHRDVKPENILISESGTAKITDFGIARLRSETITKTGLTFGTPAFMSPEQIQTARVDGKSDQFSLAVVGYYLITGQKPFDADSDPAQMYKIVYEEPPLVSDLPRGANDALRRALRKCPNDRYDTCAAFISALSAALMDVSKSPEYHTTGKEAERKTVESNNAKESDSRTTENTPDESEDNSPSSRRGNFILIVRENPSILVLIALFLFIGGALIIRMGPQVPASSTTVGVAP